MSVRSGLDLEKVWHEASPYERFAAEVTELRELWSGVYRLARVPDWAADRARRHAGRVRLLVINEDWCWDAANTVPVLARMSDAAGGPEIRVVGRDAHPEVMDQYLTNGTRSIPIVIVLDREFRELGAWGPRPRDIQAWATEHKGRMSKDEFYKELRRRFARDKGESTLREVLELFPDE